jgi:hypothetical protein
VVSGDENGKSNIRTNDGFTDSGLINLERAPLFAVLSNMVGSVSPAEQFYALAA